jgi:hypothetical protein
MYSMKKEVGRGTMNIEPRVDLQTLKLEKVENPASSLITSFTSKAIAMVHVIYFKINNLKCADL